MENFKKDYNTQRDKLAISEYGRNIQKMVKYALSMEDRNLRTQYAYVIFDVMQQINPNDKPNDDYYKKLWNHMHIISDFKLDIDYPYEVASKEVIEKKPEQIPYKTNRIKYRFYGVNLENVIKTLAEEEQNDDIQNILAGIADQMKYKYINWNEEIVSDELIAEHLKNISDGKLIFDYEANPLTSANQILKEVQKKENNQNKSRGKKHSHKQNNRGRKPRYNKRRR